MEYQFTPISNLDADTISALLEENVLLRENVHDYMLEWAKDLLNDDEDLNSSGVTWYLSKKGNVSVSIVSTRDFEDMKSYSYLDNLSLETKNFFDKISLSMERAIDDALDEADEIENSDERAFFIEDRKREIEEEYREQIDTFGKMVERDLNAYAEGIVENAAGEYAMICEIKNTQNYDYLLLNANSGELFDVSKFFEYKHAPVNMISPTSIDMICAAISQSQDRTLLNGLAINEDLVRDFPVIREALLANHREYQKHDPETGLLITGPALFDKNRQRLLSMDGEKALSPTQKKTLDKIKAQNRENSHSNGMDI